MRPVHHRDVGTKQFQVRLVNQFGGAQRVSGGFARHMAPGNDAELVIDQRHELIQGLLSATAPVVQQLRHSMGLCAHCFQPGFYCPAFQRGLSILRHLASPEMYRKNVSRSSERFRRLFLLTQCEDSNLCINK